MKNRRGYFCSIHAPEIERSYTIDEDEGNCFRTEMDSYKPIQPVNYDHGVCTFPITTACGGLNSHILQVHYILAMRSFFSSRLLCNWVM